MKDLDLIVDPKNKDLENIWVNVEQVQEPKDKRADYEHACLFQPLKFAQ